MRVIIIGSGMAGLTAATDLVDAGHDVVVLDKGRVAGGRMSTRVQGAHRFDHGAQHFSVRTEPFARVVRAWLDEGIAAVWYEGSSVTQPNRGREPRHVGLGGMRTIPVSLADQLDVRQSTAVRGIDIEGGTVSVRTSDGPVVGDAVILTPPVPQTQSLLTDSGIPLPGDIATMLDEVDYDASLTVMAVLDGPSGLPDGHLALRDGPVAWIADNQHKGVSRTPTLTIQSTAAFADEHLEADPSSWVDSLTDAAAPHLEAGIVEASGHRWRYSQPRTTFDVGAVRFDAGVPVVLAGEVFAGAKVEGAFTSGRAAAHLLIG